MPPTHFERRSEVLYVRWNGREKNASDALMDGMRHDCLTVDMHFSQNQTSENVRARANEWVCGARTLHILIRTAIDGENGARI